MSFEIKPATLQGNILLMELWGGTGGGKTESALRIARGMAGPSGRVGIIDTEHKRATYCLDRIPGGFLTIDFEAPYTPERYVEALELLERSVDVGVLDSGTHCWEGPDGILDLHEQALDRMTKGSDDYSERERLNWPAWREPKRRYKALRGKLLNFKIPLIICVRGEEKSRMEKNEKGKNIVVTDKTTTPVFDKKFVFETDVAVEVFQKDGAGGYIRFPYPYAKVSHEDIRAILPTSGVGQLSIEIGAALAHWCASRGKAPSNGVPKSASVPAVPVRVPVSERTTLVREIWDKTTAVHGDNKTNGKHALTLWLREEKFITAEETLENLSVDRLKEIILAINKKEKA